MKQTVLRIEYISEDSIKTVCFNADEVHELRINTRQDFTIKRLQNRRPFMYLLSGEYRQFFLQVLTVSRATLLKLKNLRNNENVMNLYYDVRDNPSLTAPVRLKPDFPFLYSMGRPAANRVIDLEFHEVNQGPEYLSVVTDDDTAAV
ncbi:hypothetical protein JXQ31_04030 [candidate division KSB1 bacterium]|nr:hypothetical protein [candidate division KSB1 bacterium]